MLTRTLTLAAAAALTVTATLNAATVDREFSKYFDVTPGMTLKLIHGDGFVDIRSWDENRLAVTVRYHMESRGLGGGKRDFSADFERRGDTVVVEGHEVGVNFFVGSMRTLEYVYTVQAPSYLRLELLGDDGDVEIRGWQADIDLRLEDGDVRIDGLKGNLTATLDDGDLELLDCAVGEASVRLEDGDVKLRGGSGSWHFTVDDGDLDLRDLAASALEVSAADGDIEVALAPSATVEVDIRTDDGDIDIGLFAGLSARLSIDVDDGSIGLHAADLVVESKTEHHITGTIGDGRGEIRLRTNDGDVTLRDQL